MSRQKLGRFGKIKKTNHTAPQDYGHKGGNTAAGWWVMDAAFPFAGIAAQEDHQFHENWKWGFWPFIIGSLGFAVSVALDPFSFGSESILWYVVSGLCLLFAFWGVGNVTFLQRHSRTEMTGQVVESLIAFDYYDVDVDYYRQRQADQMEYYRDKKGKGFFKGWSDERIADEMVRREEEAQRWIDKHEDAIERYLTADKFRNRVQS